MFPFVNILLVFEGISFLVALIYLKRLRREGLLFIFVLLLTVAFSEAVGKLIDIKAIRFINTGRWFNIMVPVQFLCLFMLFYKKTAYKYWRWVVKVFMVLTVTITFLFFLWGEKENFNTLNYTIESIFISACCLHYLFECMNNRQIVFINKDIMMYLALGTLLFYLGTLPFHSMFNYLYKNHKSIFYTYKQLFYILNYIMYGLISFGIIWGKKK